MPRLAPLLFSSGIAAAVSVASFKERNNCPYWKAVGVLSDLIEISCGGERSDNVLDPTAQESVALACCPEPYGRCNAAERVAGCDETIVPILQSSGTTDSQEAWRGALQRARGALVAADERCSVLAPEMPHATCKGENLAGRNDIYCEMMLFQTEQLGDGDPEEYKGIGCPWPGDKVQKAGATKGRAMTRKLKKSDLPELWDHEEL